ncbi:MAG: hypothetical protein VXX28_02680, partial [Verrucomicrobiota bacterium]|nr:hypothetical protein [Verrucomicrobiota bacterium]
MKNRTLLFLHSMLLAFGFLYAPKFLSADQEGHAPDSLVGWTLRMEITSSDGESDVDLISFSADQATETDEDGSGHQHVSSYTLEKVGESTLIVRLSENPNAATDEITLNFDTDYSGSGNFDDFALLDSSQADESFEATATPGLYKDLYGS